jgi:hypothetical protein
MQRKSSSAYFVSYNTTNALSIEQQAIDEPSKSQEKSSNDGATTQANPKIKETSAEKEEPFARRVKQRKNPFRELLPKGYLSRACHANDFSLYRMDG